MLRLVLLLILLILLISWMERVLKRLAGAAAQEQDPVLNAEGAGRGGKAVKQGRLIACSVCGVHVVESQARAGSGPLSSVLPPGSGHRMYCSETCLQEARSAS